LNMVQLTEKEQQARMMIFLPLDNLPTFTDLKWRVDEQHEYVGNYKIGMGSFTRFGHPAIKTCHNKGVRVFLDLKYHDIPATVYDAVRAATELGVYMVNVHASGGPAMLEAARKGADDAAKELKHEPPKVIGVTVLTSLDEANYLKTFQPANPALQGIDFNPYASMAKDDEQLQDEFRKLLETHGLTGVIQKQVRHLAMMTHEAGLDGIVCSAADLKDVKQYLPDHFLTVTPGVKGVITEAGPDQARVATPANAVKWGSDYPVIGRAITGPDTPKERQAAAYAILKDMAKEL
jgi:orotidine-5'-phosphate decarboxylase